MANVSLCCQVCHATFWRVGEIKKHVLSSIHKKKMEEVFQKDKFCGYGFPYIVMVDPHYKHRLKQPIIGLSLVTLCFSPDISTFFYLCHVCEEKCLPEKIIGHLNSGDHCSNYFTYMDPNALSYSWIPSMNMREILKHEISKEISKAEARQLQMLDLPEGLLKKLAPFTYSRVIQSLSENDKLLKPLEAVELKRMLLQKYQKDTTRKHPLLGMQHIVECVCVGPDQRRHYLCTLCNLTFTPHMIIKHVLSFDHIFGYFRVWHPSTLLSKESYTNYFAFASLILDLAKQTEEAHGAAINNLKQVQLEPAEYTAINFACYNEALKELESIRKKKGESCLATVVSPGQNLVKQETAGLRLPSSEHGPVGQCGPQLPVPLRIRCQECNINFDSKSQYLQHLRSVSHQQLLREHFGNKDSGFKHEGQEPQLKSYTYLEECSKSQPAIGVSLVVTCISSEAQDEPVCVCFACSECFLDSSAKTHFNSQSHIINTLLRLNPWRLPLGWYNFQDLAALGSAAKEEERERELHLAVMKILDIPLLMLKDLKPPSYKKAVLTTLKQHYTLLTCEVPPSETNTKLKDKERFPLLGREFLVKFIASIGKCPMTRAALLCTLCQRRVSFKENYAHVFGQEHIQKFINCFHPGSLNQKMDEETLLDLAKQALSHHPVRNIQEIELDRPLQEPFVYRQAFFVLQAVKKKQGKGLLIPLITPKMKLFPRGSLEDTAKKPEKDNNPVNSRMVENSEKKCPVSTDSPVDTEDGTEVKMTQCAGNTEQKVDLKHLTPSEKDSVKTVKEELKSAAETCETIKKEEVEIPVKSKPSDEKTESCEYRQTDLSIDTGVQCAKKLTNFENFPCKEEEIETLISTSKESKDTCLSDVSDKKMGFGQNRFITEAQSLPSGRQKEETEAEEEETEAEEEETKAEVEGGKTSQESVKNKDISVSMQKKHFKSEVTSGLPTSSQHQHLDQLWQYIKTTDREPVIGLSALLECKCEQHNPIYLCECCSEKILEKDIISHVSGVNHHKMAMGSKDLPSLPGAHKGMGINHFAALFEKHYGYGKAQVFDVDEEVYHDVLTQNFESALRTVKTLQAQQNSVCEPILAPVLSTAQPMDTSPIPEIRHELSFVKDNCQATDMEIEGGLKDSGENASSITSTKTSEVAPDSSEDVKMSLGKESHFSHNTYYCQSVVKSKEAESPCVSTRGTDATCIQPDSRQNVFNLGITLDTAVRPKPEEKNVESSQDADTSDTALTTSNKAMTTISKHQAKAPSSAPESLSKTAAPVSKLTANLSSSTVAKSGKCAASTSSARATTFKAYTANSSKSSTTTVPAGASAATKPTEGNTATSTAIITTTAAVTRSSQTTSSSGILAATTSCKSTHNFSTSLSVHWATTKESTTTNHSIITSTNKFAAPTNSCNVTKTNSRETAYKCATSTICTSATSIKPTGASPDTGTSKTTSALKPVTGKTETKSSVVQEASCRPPPAATSQAVVSSVPSAKLSVKCGNTEVSSKTAVEKKSVVSNADIADNNSSSTFKGTLTIGLNYGIKVSCGKRLQVYCRLCSSRLRRTGHFSSFRHKSNYVKMKYPTWTAKQSEMKSKLDKIVAHLAEIEKDVETKEPEKLEVNLKTYKELGDPLLPEDKAFEKLMEKMMQKDSGVSSSTADLADVWTPDTAFSNSPEALSPDDEMNLWQNETAGLHPEIHSQNKEVPRAKIPVLAQQKTFESDEEFRAEVQVTPEVTQSHHLPHFQPQAAKTPQNDTVPQTFNLEPILIAQVVNASQEAPGKTNQLERRDSETQVSENTSPVQYSSPEKLLSAASVKTGQQNQQRPSQTVKQDPAQHEWTSRPENDHAPQALPKIPIGDMYRGGSHLSAYLAVKGLNSEPVIGLGAMWECRGLQLTTFYLCTSCSERLFINDIYKHMISYKHQLNHMRKEYCQLMEFWKMNDLQPEIEQNIFREVLIEVSQRERNLKKDAQFIVLPEDLYKYVKSAPFSEALRFLQDSKTSQKLNIVCPPSSALQQDQLPCEDQSQTGSQSTETQPTQAPETDKTCDEVRPKAEEQHLDRIIQRKVLSPSEETSVCSEDDSSVAQVPEAGTCLSPQETSSSQTEHKLPVSQPGLPVKQAELHPESPSFSPSSNDGSKLSPPSLVFIGDKSLLTRKRQSDTCVETFAKSYMGDPQREEPLPPKRTCSSLQPSTESAPEPCSGPTATSFTLLSTEDKTTEPGPETPNTGITIYDLFALVVETRSEKKMSPCKAAQPNSEPSTSCATTPSVGVKIKLGPESEQISSEAPAKKKRWDLEPQLDHATHGTSLPPATTVDSREQQNQGSVDAQSISGKINLVKANPISEDTSHYPEPPVTTEPVKREVSPLPINAIVTPRLDRHERQLMVSSNMQGYTAVNSPATQSLSSVETVSHNNTQAASAGYDQTIQMGYTTNGHSYYLAPGNFGGFTTPFHPFVFTPSPYQGGGYIPGRAYQSLGWMGVLQLQQQQQQQQQQQRFIQQQQLFQHQYMCPPSVSAAAAASTGTSGTAFQGPSHIYSPQLTDFPQYEQVQHPNIPQQPADHNTK